MDNKCDYLNKNVNSLADNDDESESETTKEKNTCIYAFFVALVTVHICGLIGVAYFAFAKGSPAKILNPTNSKGEQCGHGNQTGKPLLLYFDLTKCARLSALEGGCPTPQVCVTECPNTYWASVQGKAAGLQQFCKEMAHWNTTDISQLVAERFCPAYILPSKSVLGRCVPVIGLGGRDEEGRAAAKISAMLNADGQDLLLDSLMKGIYYVMDTIEARRYDKKILAPITVNWWIILTTYLAGLFLSLTWTLLLKVAAKAVLWTSTIFCIPILMAWAVFSFSRYRDTGTGKKDQEDIISTSLSSYQYNKIMWLVCGIILLLTSLIILTLGVYYISSISITIKHILGASRAFSCVKIVFFPFIKCLVQVFIIIFSLVVSIFLASTGSAEYRIVDACSSETCFNNYTGKMFSFHDTCNQETFAECTGCPHAQCVFHKFGTDTLAWWLQAYNLVGTLGLLFFVHCFRYSVVTVCRNISYVGLLSSIKKTSNKNFKRADLRSWLPLRIDQKNVWGENIWAARFKTWKSLLRNSDIMRRVTKLIIISSKLCITGIATAIALIIFSSQYDKSLDAQLNYQYGFIFILIFGVYIITSSFLDIYNIEVDRDVVEGIDNHGSVDVEITNNAELQTISTVEENTISFDVNRNFGKRMENKKLNSTDYSKHI